MRSLLLLGLIGCAAPRVSERPVERAIAEGVASLVRSQQPEGFWGTGRGSTGFDVMASVPGSHDAFRTGATALATLALREAGEREASAKGLAWLAAYDGLRRATPWEIYNVWGHTYALQALSTAFREDGVEAWKAGAQRHLDALARYETVVGGWNYYDFIVGARTPSMEPTSFGTAAGLVALHEAERAGLAVPESLRTRALRRLREMRLPDGSFLYGSDFRYMPVHHANRMHGSLGRTQAGHDALQLWKAVGEAEIRAGLDAFFAGHRFLDLARKRQYPHEAWYFNSGYYYYFGHYHAARLIERLSDPGDYPAKLRSCILPYQEPDGSWWDYQMWDYDTVYGTAFAVMSLLRVASSK